MNLITDHIDLWTSTVKAKSSAGRGAGKKRELYGINKLRELILELAIRGLLIPQETHDINASVLIKEITKNKLQLLKEKKIKKEKKLPDISPIDEPYKLPLGWEWGYFKSLVTLYHVGLDRGKQQQGINLDYRYFKMNNILNKGGFCIKNIVTINADKNEVEKFSLDTGDLLFNTRNSQELVGKTCVYEEDEKGPVLYNNNILRAKFTHPVIGKTLDLWMRSLSGKKQLDQLKSGTTNVWAIYQGKLEGLLCPLPPLAEQHRIVAKVDELMGLCDKLEQQTEDHIETHETLVKTLLDTLTTASDPAQFQQAWQQIESSFHLLFTTESSIDHLKQTILQLAVMGTLVPQDPNDEPASQLLKRIATEKAQLVKEKKIKKQKPFISFDGLDDLKTTIPKEWEWVKLAEIADIVRGGSPRPAGDPRYYGGKIPFLKVGNITNKKGKFVEGYSHTIKEAGLHKTRYIDEQTVLLSNSGATLGIPAICDFPATFNDGIAAFVEQSKTITDEYLYLVLKNLTKWFLDIASRGQGQPNLNTDIIKTTWIPLAPIKEQKRIVAKVEELMTLCDTLKGKITTSQTTQLTLTDSIVSQATN